LFQLVNDASSPAVIEVVNEAIRAHEHAPASEPKLTSPSHVVVAIKGRGVGKVPGPNGIPNRVLRHHPKRTITFLTKVCNAFLLRQYFPPAWKHARVVSMLKPERTLSLFSLLDTAVKLFEEIQLTRVLREVNERGLLRDEQFGFRARVSTELQLACLFDSQ
jgi:hypothetical protein